MINKLKGFTLAEVLITLGIIGIVAAMSAPMLMQHASSAKSGPALSRGISALSNGLQSYLFNHDSNTITGISEEVGKSPKTLFENLSSSNIKMSASGVTPRNLYLKNSEESPTVASSDVSVFQFADKSAVFIPNAECNPATNTNPAGLCKFYFLPLGWANKKGKLLLGDDVFELAYDNNGNIKIYGLEYGDSWETKCTDEQVKTFTPNSNKKSCGGRIAAMNFKKDY